MPHVLCVLIQVREEKERTSGAIVVHKRKNRAGNEPDIKCSYWVSGQRIYKLQRTSNEVSCVTAIVTVPDDKC
jgi:hypothetical protein